MLHDQMCPNTPETFHDGVLWPAVCECELIGRVRKDEEDKFLWRYSAAEQRGYKAGEQAGCAAALRDAAEAVKALPIPTLPERYGILTPMLFRADVVAAIEALGGEE